MLSEDSDKPHVRNYLPLTRNKQTMCNFPLKVVQNLSVSDSVAVGGNKHFFHRRTAGITALQRDERWSRHFLQSSTVSGFHLSLQQRTAAHLNIIKNKQKKEMSASVVLVHKITRLFTASSSYCCRCALV